MSSRVWLGPIGVGLASFVGEHEPPVAGCDLAFEPSHCCFVGGDISTPFGGYKQSGFVGRDNSVYAHEQYTELKTIWIDLSDGTLEEPID